MQRLNTLYEKLRAFAETTLPPDVVMALECAEDETGDGRLSVYGEQLRRAAVEKTPVYPGAVREFHFREGERLTVLLLPETLKPVFGSREDGETLIRKLADNWCFAGIGFGETSAKAEENAVRALAVPADHMVCPGKLKPLQKALYGEKKALRISGKDGGGNFCAVYAAPWALRRADGKLLDEFV